MTEEVLLLYSIVWCTSYVITDLEIWRWTFILFIASVIYFLCSFIKQIHRMFNSNCLVTHFLIVFTIFVTCFNKSLRLSQMGATSWYCHLLTHSTSLSYIAWMRQAFLALIQYLYQKRCAETMVLFFCYGLRKFCVQFFL